MLQQFNQVKKILIIFSFKDRNKNVLSTLINYNVIHELRRERKIKMVIGDVGVDDYINMDMTEIDIYNSSKYLISQGKIMI